MSGYDIEMSYNVGVSLHMEADNEKEAIEKAREMVKEEVSINSGFGTIEDVSDLEFKQVSYIAKVANIVCKKRI